MASHGIRDRVAIVGMGCTSFGESWDKANLDSAAAAYDLALFYTGVEDAIIADELPPRAAGRQAGAAGGEQRLGRGDAPARLRQAAGAASRAGEEARFPVVRCHPAPPRRHRSLA